MNELQLGTIEDQKEAEKFWSSMSDNFEWIVVDKDVTFKYNMFLLSEDI